MANLLPEKLTELRKHYGYAQADIAEKLQVDLSVYLNWENGNAIAPIGSLKQLAELYHIPLQTLVDNTRSLDLPKADSMGDSIEIPFMNKVGGVPYNTTGDVGDQGFENTILPIDGYVEDAINQGTAEEKEASGETKKVEAPENLGDTKVMDSATFAETKMSEIVDGADEEEAPEDDEEEQPKPKKVEKAKPSSNKKKKLHLKKPVIIGIAAAAVAVIVLIAVLVSGGKSKTTVDLSSDNRLALGNGFAMYVRGKGDVVMSGDSAPSIDTSDAVQVSAYGNFALVLNSDGTVLSSASGDAGNVSKWKDIVMVAAGEGHSVGLKSDGTVVCTGSTTACAVDDWTDIKKVYAGNEITVGLKSDGSMEVSGGASGSSQWWKQTKVASVAFSDTQVALVNNSGNVTCYALGSSGSSNTATWTGMDLVAVGDSFAAGLDSGKVTIASSDEDFAKAADTWSNIRYIAANGSTLIAVDASGNIFGAGDNSYHVYGTTATASPSASATASTQLASVTNVKFSTTAANLSITWDSVDNADYYELSVNTSPVTTVRTQKASASVSSDKLTDGTSYTVTITAYSNKDTYKASKATEVTYTYVANTIKLSTPGNIKGSLDSSGTKLTLTWNAVANAGSYEVKVSGINYDSTVTTNSVTVDLSNASNGSYTVTVAALPAAGQTRYSRSDDASGTINFTAPTPTPTATPTPSLAATSISTSVDGTSGALTVSWNAVSNASNYLVTLTKSSGTTISKNVSDTSATFTSSDGLTDDTYTITVTASASGYTSSVSTMTNYSYKSPSQPTPTASTDTEESEG